MKEVSIIQFPLPAPSGPCPNCQGTDILFDPVIDDGKAGGIITCGDCGMEWDASPGGPITVSIPDKEG